MSALAAVWVISAFGVGCDTKPGALTKAGTTPVPGFTAAADPAVLPMGSIVWIEGLGERMVTDVGSKVKGRTLDVFWDSCEGARRWGRQRRGVTVLHRGGTR